MTESDLKPDLIVGKKTVKPVLFSLLILVSGIIIGAGMTLLVSDSVPDPKTLPPGPEYISNRMVQRIIHELHLDPEQQEQLKPIIQKHMKAIDDIRKQARPQISEEVKQMNEEILSILDEPQKQMWQKNIQQMQDHFTRMRQRRGPGGQRRGEGRGPSPGERYRNGRGSGDGFRNGRIPGPGPQQEFGPDQQQNRRHGYQDRPPLEPSILPDGPPPDEQPLPEQEGPAL